MTSFSCSARSLVAAAVVLFLAFVAAGSCGVPGSFGSGYPEQFPAESRDWGITRSNHSCP